MAAMVRGRYVLLAAGLASFMPAAARAQEEVRPSLADPGVKAYDEPSLVFADKGAAAPVPLVVFLPGSGGKSAHAPRLFLETIAAQGYRVVYLAYNDEPSVSQVCPREPADCSGLFRRQRSFGDAPQSPVQNAKAEAIVPRLAALLHYLDRTHPQAGWATYVAPDGQPAWPRIILTGLSQGAGMAAYIAKRVPLKRVVLFSSPQDIGPDRQPAPWLSEPSATPMSRWWAERHVAENTTDLIANAYKALGIPSDHILLFDGSPPPNARGRNPNHTTTVRLRTYVPAWIRMFGGPKDD